MLATRRARLSFAYKGSPLARRPFKFYAYPNLLERSAAYHKNAESPHFGLNLQAVLRNPQRERVESLPARIPLRRMNEARRGDIFE